MLAFGAAAGIIPLGLIIHRVVEIPLNGYRRIIPPPRIEILHQLLSVALLSLEMRAHGAELVKCVPLVSFDGIEQGLAGVADEGEDERAGFGGEVVGVDAIGVVEFEEFAGGVGDGGGGDGRGAGGARGEAEDGVRIFGRLEEAEGVGAEGGDAGFAGGEGGGGAGIDWGCSVRRCRGKQER